MTAFRYRNEPWLAQDWSDPDKPVKDILKNRWVVQSKEHWWNRWEYVASFNKESEAEDYIGRRMLSGDWVTFK
jgi:hypothetical protein